MNIDISARHSSVPDGVREHILDRGQRISRFFEGVARCEFVLDSEAGGHVCEIKVHAPRNDLTAKAVSEDVYAAVDAALDKIEQQMRRLKGKLKDHHRGERGVDARAAPASEAPGVGGAEPTYEDVLKEEL